MADNSRYSYGTGCNAFAEFCHENHIDPQFSQETVEEDVFTLISFIDELSEVHHLQPDTISGYLSGVKNALLGQGFVSEALGVKGSRHHLVARALQSLYQDRTTVPPKPTREVFTVAMMRRAAEVWPLPYYAVAVIIRGFILRSGEILMKGHKEPKHMLYWDCVRLFDKKGRRMTKRQWSSELADSAEICPRSRKYQIRRVRRLPARHREFYPGDGAILSGLTSLKAGGCVVAALQAWYVLSAAAAGRRRLTPLCRCADGELLTQHDMLLLVHEMGEVFELPKGALVTHSLKHAGITALIGEGLSDEEVRMAAGFASVRTLAAYDHPGQQMVKRLSKAVLLDMSDSSDSAEDYEY